MSIKSIANLYDQMKKQDLVEALSPAGLDQTEEMMREIRDNANEAQSIIKSRVNEAEFVKYMAMAENATITAMVSCGEVEALKLKETGLLTDYTHTVVMAVIGGLIQDEVL